MGPETAEEWICHHLTHIRNDIQREFSGSYFYFLRFLDPDFHIRLRIYIPQRKNFSAAVNIVNLHSALLLKQGLIWKSEICTYEREVERYSSERIELFEQAFHIDSSFWLKMLPWIEQQNDSNNLRWKIALVSCYRYYQNLIGDTDESARIISKIIQSLKQEQKPGRTILFQIDQKYRSLREELMTYMEDELYRFPEVESLLRNRSDKISELFETHRKGGSYLNWSISDQNIADLVHMSLNRALRSKHRMQELIIYIYLEKLMRTQLAFR